MTYERFANPASITQSWYCAGLSRDLGPGKTLGVELFGRRLALYRGQDGVARALDARCPHLGADLAQGTVVKDRLRCGFHHWTFSGEGACVACPTAYGGAPRARARAWPVAERYGALWVFAGPEPLFSLPDFPGTQDPAVLALPAKAMRAHPHVVAMNGLDTEHFRVVHGMPFLEQPRLDQPDAFRTRLTLRARLDGGGPLAATVRALSGGVLTAEFTTWGGNLAVIEGHAGALPVRVLFSHAPAAGGGSLSRTFLIAPSRGPRAWASLAGAALVMAHILRGDGDIMDGLEFRPGFAPADSALSAFAAQVEAMPVLEPEASRV